MTPRVTLKRVLPGNDALSYPKKRFKPEAKTALEAVLASIQQCLTKGEAVNFRDFSKFYITERPAHMGCNPKTSESMEVEARKIMKFAAGETLKDSVNHRN